MPVIGQPAHTHFIPIVTPVALDRISLSVTYLYNISAASYRISLTSTYVYDLQVIISRSQVYIYNLNPLTPTGPTRLYFHAVLNPLSNLPPSERSVLTPSKTVDAETVNRLMNTIIGPAQTSLVLTSNATTALQRYYFTKFVSETFDSSFTLQTNTWTYNFATSSSAAGARFPVSSTNQPVRVVAYVWRPSISAKVGDIVDGNSNPDVDSFSTIRSHIAAFSGIQVLNVQAGDVLVFEVWFEITQGIASALTDTFYYDGAVVTTTENLTVSNHASFIQTPQGLSFGAALVRISKPCIQKYNIIARVTGFSQVYKYNIRALASLVQTYQYNITTAVSLPISYLYDLTGRISTYSRIKYNILVRMTAPKIFRYALQLRLQFSRLYKYNIGIRLTSSRIYRYKIVSSVAISQIYNYDIFSAVQFSRIYKYSLIARAALSRAYRYNVANRITNARIYRYGLATKLSLSRAYKYNLLNTLSASSHIRYSILERLSLSRTYKFNIAILVTKAQVYKYHLTSLAHVVVSTIYKYNLVQRLTSSRINLYNIANRLSLSRAYKYNLTVRAILSRVYRYPILNPVTISRTYRYSLTTAVLKTRNYLYNLLGLRQKPQTYLYNLTKTISLSRVYRYRLGSGVSLEQTYLYNTIARVSASFRYNYAIGVIPSGVLWQLTGKDTDFPDSLENLVKEFIETNWSITDPVLSTTPIITSKLSRQHQSQVDNFAYDNYRSYYIRIKEVGSEVKNRQVRLNTYEFETPLELEVFARRLSKSEAYPQLNAMINELLRIFGTYQEDGIFGVQGITLDRISSMEKERPPAMTTWARRLRIILHYYKVSVVG